MARKKKVRLSQQTVRAFDPQTLLNFTHTPWFDRDWQGIGLSDEDLAELQMQIMAGPSAAPVVRRTGGLRKVRFSPPSWNVGKSGALRVCYSYYQRFGHVLLVAVYPKTEKDTLSDEEADVCRALIEEHETHLYRIYPRLRKEP